MHNSAYLCNVQYHSLTPSSPFLQQTGLLWPFQWLLFSIALLKLVLNGTSDDNTPLNGIMGRQNISHRKHYGIFPPITTWTTSIPLKPHHVFVYNTVYSVAFEQCVFVCVLKWVPQVCVWWLILSLLYLWVCLNTDGDTGLWSAASIQLDHCSLSVRPSVYISTLSFILFLWSSLSWSLCPVSCFYSLFLLVYLLLFSY